MEPIINPLWIYFAVLSDRVHSICGIALIVSMSFYVPVLMIQFMNIDMSKENKKLSSVLKYWGFMNIGLFLACIVFPDDMTVYKMIGASFMTPDNMQIGEDAFIEFLNRAAEAVASGWNKVK